MAMRVTELMSKERVRLKVEAEDRGQVLEQLVELQARSGALSHREKVLRLVGETEPLVGEGAVLVGLRWEGVRFPSLVCMTLARPVDWGERAVDVVVLLVAPLQGNLFYGVRDGLSRGLTQEGLASLLRQASQPQEVLAAVATWERGPVPREEVRRPQTPPPEEPEEEPQEAVWEEDPTPLPVEQEDPHRAPRSGGLGENLARCLPLAVGGGVLLGAALLWQWLAPERIWLGPVAAAPLLERVGRMALALVPPVLSAQLARTMAPRSGGMVGLVAGAVACGGVSAGGWGWQQGLLGLGAGLGAGLAAGMLMGLLEYPARRMPPWAGRVWSGGVAPLLGLAGVWLAVWGGAALGEHLAGLWGAGGG